VLNINSRTRRGEPKEEMLTYVLRTAAQPHVSRISQTLSPLIQPCLSITQITHFPTVILWK
jgi:hypothetical protein